MCVYVCVSAGASDRLRSVVRTKQRARDSALRVDVAVALDRRRHCSCCSCSCCCCLSLKSFFCVVELHFKHSWKVHFAQGYVPRATTSSTHWNASRVMCVHIHSQNDSDEKQGIKHLPFTCLSLALPLGEPTEQSRLHLLIPCMHARVYAALSRDSQHATRARMSVDTKRARS